MLIHLLKLVWNRKRANVLLMLEILAAFLVVFAIVGSLLHIFQHYKRPVGYDHQNVWSVEIHRSAGERYGEWTDDEVDAVKRLMREAEALEPVVAVAVGSNRPYSNTNTLNYWEFQGRTIEAEFFTASDGYQEVLGIELAQGRWFEPADAALAWDPVVINPELAEELFEDEDPIDQYIQDDDAEEKRRVIGVLQAWRRGGELSPPRPAYFGRAGDTAENSGELSHLVLKVAPGTPADFEEPLTERLHAVAPEWSFAIKTLEADRQEQRKSVMLPMLLSATVGGFLVLMVVLGLTGVMWQNVTRRTKEIGVRRAMGASRFDVHRQIVAEVVITAAFGLLLGVLVVVQVPLLGLFGDLSFSVVLAAMAVAVSFMLLLAAGCGLYPGWTATRIQPAQALHYE